MQRSARAQAFFALLVVLSVVVLHLIVLAGAAQAQTRLFPRGTTGFSGAGDYKGGNFSNCGVHAGFTYRGFFDLGAGYLDEDQISDSSHGKKYIFANAVLLHPRAPSGFGLELRGRYSRQSLTKGLLYFPGYFLPPLKEIFNQIYQVGLRPYYRKVGDSRFEFIWGVSGFYQFQKMQYLDSSSNVLLGHDWGAWGFELDFHWLIDKRYFLGLRKGAYQKPFDSGLEHTNLISMGVVFGLGKGKEVGSNE